MFDYNYTHRSSHECLLSQVFDYYNITDLPNTVEPLWGVFATINGIAAPPTTVINFLIIWTILKDESLRRVSHNFLLAALAVTDFLAGLIVEPFYTWYLISIIQRRPLPCHFTMYIVPAMVCSCWTINTLMIATVDLYLAVEHPQFYLEHVTTTKTAIGTAIVWIVMLSGLFSGHVIADSTTNLRKLPTMIVGVIHVIVILYCTVKIHMTGHRQRRAIQAQKDVVQQHTQEEQEEINGKRGQQRRAVMTISMLVMASVLFYLPYIIVGIIHSTQGPDVTDDFRYTSFTVGITFVHLQSLVNPIIMSLRLSYIRDGVKKIVPCLRN